MSRILRAEHDRFPLKAPFRISRGVKTAADVVMVTIADGGAIGRGEAVPYPRYGESVESALTAIESVRDLVEQGGGRQAPPCFVVRLHSQLRDRFESVSVDLIPGLSRSTVRAGDRCFEPWVVG